MTAHQAATKATANVPCGGIGVSAETCRYSSRAVDPNKPRYAMPSCSWVECITPDWPDRIAPAAATVNMPRTDT